jgi:hypothetical protein
MAGAEGFEPPTYGFGDRIVASRQVVRRPETARIVSEIGVSIPRKSPKVTTVPRKLGCNWVAARSSELSSDRTGIMTDASTVGLLR